MSVKIFDTMTTATPNFPLAYADKINMKLQDGSESDIQSLYDNGSLGGGGATYVQLSQEEYDNLEDSIKLDGREYRTYDTGHIYRHGVEFGKDACFTSLSQLGLTADVTVEDVVNALKNGESFLAPVNTFTNYETIFPNKVPNDKWNKIHIIKGVSLGNSHIRCFSQSGACEYLANVNNTNVVSWNDVSGTYIDISDSIIEKLGNEILKYPVGKYRINSTTTGNKFIDLPSDAEIKCGLIEINGTAVGKSPFTDTWVYRMYKFECLTGSLVYTRRLNSGATVGQIESDTGWCVKQNIYTSLKELGLDTTATINDIIGKMANGSQFTYKTDVFDYATEYNNIQYGTVTIHKQSVSRVQVFMTDKDTGNLYVGRMDNTNKIVKWARMITDKSDPYACTSYTALTGTEDLFTLPCGHYVSDKINTTYNYPVTDRSNATAHIYVLGHLNDPANNKGYRIILYFDNKGRAYRINEWWGGFSNGWQNMGDKTTLVANTPTLKLDITKKNSSWYGAIKLTYLYDTSPVEVEISFRAATEDIRWTVISGQKYINKITYTQDSSNTAHYTIGIEFAGTTYGCYQAEVIGGFADINSLTKDAFTGDKTAVYYSPYGKNNGVTLVSAPEDIGLTFPCTTVQLVQAMRNKFNRTISSGAIGVFNNGSKTITDAPNDYGLLHIECFGHDRMLIRYDGIGGSIYAGSWIGRIKGSNGTFSEVTWQRIDNTYSVNEVIVGTWLDGKTIYRKTFTKSPTSNQATGNQVTIDVATISGLTNVIDIQATAKLYNYNKTSAPIYAKIPFSEMWRSNGASASYVDSVYVEGTTLKLHANNCTPEDIYYVTVEYTK